MRKPILFLVIVTVCFLSAGEPAPKPAASAGGAEKEFTIEELAKFDGKEGRPAYVAIEGIVYEVTDVKAWKKGEHGGGKAGTDITALITTKSPHGIKVTRNLRPVGKLKK